MKFKEMQELLKQSLPEKRYKHSIQVMRTAEKYARIYGLNVNKVAVAALLHDCGRQVESRFLFDTAKKLGIEMDPVEALQPILLHAKIGVWYAKHKYGVTDPEILHAIRCHTTGVRGMTAFDKVVYLADLLEPDRDFPGVEKLRQIAMVDMDKAMLLGLRNSMQYLLKYNLLVHPDSVDYYNELAGMLKRKNRGND